MNEKDIKISVSIVRMFGCIWAIWGANNTKEMILILALMFFLAEALTLIMTLCKDEKLYTRRKQ